MARRMLMKLLSTGNQLYLLAALRMNRDISRLLQMMSRK